MTPRDQGVLKTLSLLTMLSRSKKQVAFGLPEEEEYILTVTKQNLADADLTLPELANTLHLIAEKGYVWHVVIHDENVRSQINDFKNSDQYNGFMNELKKLDTKELSGKITTESIEGFNKMVPKSVDFDYGEISKDILKVSELFNDGMEIFSKIKPNEIGLVLLMPFRDIDILFKKVSSGKSIDDIQDDGFWYDKDKCEFHIDGEIIKTSNRGLPNLSHSVLSHIFSNPNSPKIDYDEMTDFDPSKSLESYRDAMKYFTNKHPKLKHMFSVGLYGTEFDPLKYTDIP